MQPKSERFEMRLDQVTLDRLDAWRARQDDLPSRAEAVRRLVEAGVGRADTQDAQLSDGEKLLLLLLGTLAKQLKIRGDGDIDPAFIEEVIHGGHYWALGWKYPGVFHGHKDNQGTLREVLDVLEMWSLIEFSYLRFSPEEKEQIAEEVGTLGKHVHFPGFDGNHEAEHLGIAIFLINDLDRFAEFKGRDLNAHRPTLAIYRRMLTVFRTLPSLNLGGVLNASDVSALLREQIHPDRRSDATNRDES